MIRSQQISASTTYFPHEAGGAGDEDGLAVVELQDGGVVVSFHHDSAPPGLGSL